MEKNFNSIADLALVKLIFIKKLGELMGNIAFNKFCKENNIKID